MDKKTNWWSTKKRRKLFDVCPKDEKIRKNRYDNVKTTKRKLLPIISERRLKELPSLYTEISTDQTKKITAAKKEIDKIIKQVPPTPKKRFKIHYDEKDNITIGEEWMQMKKIKEYTYMGK